MVKSKKAKKKTQDFQRVKLKVGRKLKKTNDTDTSFKAAKVVLLKQFATADSSAPVTHRRVPLEKLIEQTHHHNHNVQKDAVMGMREILVGHSELLVMKLSELSDVVASLVVNEDGAVRQALMSLAKVIFSTAKETDILPHFSLLVASTSCALTSIDAGVKRCGLTLMELLLHHYVRLARTSWALMNNFLSLCGAQENKPGAVSTTGRKLIPLERKELIIGLAARLLYYDVVHSENVSATGPPFLIPLVSRIGMENDSDYLECTAKLFLICQRMVPFIHDVWLELTASEGVESCKRSFPVHTLLSLLNTVRIHVILLKRCVDILDGNFSSDARNLQSFIVKVYSKKFLAKYKAVIPCTTKSLNSKQQKSGHSFVWGNALSGSELCKCLSSAVLDMTNILETFKP